MLHWVHATAFFVLLGSGLVLYLPALSTAVGRRPLVKDVHFWTGDRLGGRDRSSIAVLGNRRALRATVREIDLFDRDDGRFLRRDTARPQGVQRRPGITHVAIAAKTISANRIVYAEGSVNRRFPCEPAGAPGAALIPDSAGTIGWSLNLGPGPFAAYATYTQGKNP